MRSDVRSRPPVASVGGAVVKKKMPWWVDSISITASPSERRRMEAEIRVPRLTVHLPSA